VPDKPDRTHLRCISGHPLFLQTAILFSYNYSGCAITCTIANEAGQATSLTAVDQAMRHANTIGSAYVQLDESQELRQMRLHFTPTINSSSSCCCCCCCYSSRGGHSYHRGATAAGQRRCTYCECQSGCKTKRSCSCSWQRSKRAAVQGGPEQQHNTNMFLVCCLM
jgi:hypothetical protein